MSGFKTKFDFYRDLFEKSLTEYFDNVTSVPEKLLSPMKYAVSDGGKRVRPVLCYAVGEMLNIKTEDVKNFALAIEFIHSYSLVHDDLPAMDNDDYRRGKLSTHKKFGEGTVGNITVSGDMTVLTVDFDKFGRKNIISSVVSKL